MFDIGNDYTLETCGSAEKTSSKKKNAILDELTSIDRWFYRWCFSTFFKREKVLKKHFRLKFHRTLFYYCQVIRANVQKVRSWKIEEKKR